MDGFQTRVTARTCLGFLLLVLLQTSTEAKICTIPPFENFPENNEVGAVVKAFEISDGVTLTLGPTNDRNLFDIKGNELIATAELDREKTPSLTVVIICTDTAGIKEDNTFIIFLTDVNDNPPVFLKDPYEITVSELTAVDTSIGKVVANDVDDQTLYYTLKPDSSLFKLRSPTNPDILIAAPLEYHKVKNVLLTLEVQDTPFSASTTINVTIIDVDNRPPWFQPCEQLEVDGVVSCYSTGYTSMVISNKTEPGPLELKPEPLRAIDGDSGINEAITYSILSGDDTGLFSIDKDTGEITMLRVANMHGDIVLTVRASQKVNIYQFAVTTVTISFKDESPSPPVFEKRLYEGVVAESGTMVMNLNNRTEPLQIIAKDADYGDSGGVNPHIAYNTNRSNEFRIIEGYLFMIRDLPEATYTMQVTAEDTTNGESATTELLVRVETGLTTTTAKAPLGTTSNTATTTKGGSVPDGTTTSHIIPSPQTTPPKTTTTNPSGPTGDSVAPTKPNQTSQGGVTTTGTAQPYTGSTITKEPPGTMGTTGNTATGGSSGGNSTASTAPTSTGGDGGGGGVDKGRYKLEHMLALGLTLGILLLICLVVIILLACHIKRRKQDWEKIYETTVFRSSLGIGPQKDGIQYFNKAFQNDYVEGNLGSRGPEERSKKTDGGFPVYETVLKSSVLLPDILPDNTSQASSDKSDEEKEVKPILTKEKRLKSEEEYKAVWFKEDIDPDAKVEVVIIPDRRGNDSEVEDDDAQSSIRDTDLESESESKTGDRTDDSEDGRGLSVDL